MSPDIGMTLGYEQLDPVQIETLLFNLTNQVELFEAWKVKGTGRRGRSRKGRRIEGMLSVTQAFVAFQGWQGTHRQSVSSSIQVQHSIFGIFNE